MKCISFTNPNVITHLYYLIVSATTGFVHAKKLGGTPLTSETIFRNNFF